MGFSKLIDKVTQAEQALEARERSVSADWRQLKVAWRQAWTPGRIVVAGLAAGFLGGRLPLAGMASATGSGVLQIVTALSGLVATGSAQLDDMDGDDAAADDATDAPEARATNHASTATPSSSQLATAAAVDPLLDHETLRRQGLL